MNGVLQENMQLIERLSLECINTGNMELADELIGLDLVFTRRGKRPAVSRKPFRWSESHSQTFTLLSRASSPKGTA